MRNMLSDNTNYAKVGKKTGTIIGSLLVAAVCFGFAGCSKKQTIVPDSIPQSEESFSVADPVPDASLDTFPEPIEEAQIPVKHPHTVFFAFDSDVISETEAINLKLWYNTVKPITAIPVITGHACQIGTDEYNLELSRRRAESVADAMRTLGVDYITIRALGESECFMDPQNYDKCRKAVITFN